MTGAYALMEMLKIEGVTHVFGNPGTAEGAIIDALEHHPDFTYVLGTQEGVVMGMADAYARLTGTVGVVNLHIDSGLANGISLLTNAFEGGTPMVVTSANKDVRKLAEGRVPLERMTEQFTKWSVEVTHPEQIPSVMRRAFQEAKSAPTGPVYISFAANALDDEGEMEIVPSDRRFDQPRPDARAIIEAGSILAEAAHSVLIVGDRVAQAGGVDEAVRLAELTGARVYNTGTGSVNFPTGHPQFLGPLNATMPAGRVALIEADVVVVVGTSFGGYFYFAGRALPSGAKLIHIDQNAAEIGKSEPTDVGITASPKAALQELADELDARISGEAREAAVIRAATVADEHAARRAAWQQRAEQRWDLFPMSTERMMSEVADAIPTNALIVDDSITTRASVTGAIEFNEPENLLGITGGALGWGMGAALGAKLARPDQPVIAIIGDGSSMMTVQALWTAAASRIPVVYVICNNQSYRILKLNMNVYKTQIRGEIKPDSKYLAMDFPVRFDIAAIAEAIGVRGHTIEDPTTLAAAVRNAIALNEPVVLDVHIDGSL
jgi:benzoylformate decarboxylase